jgi:N-methylhydantoinase A
MMVKDYSRTAMLRGDDVARPRLDEEFHGMEHLAREELRAEGLPVDPMEARRFLDARYVGQSFELTIDYPSPTRRSDLRPSIADSFYRAHLQRIGYADRGERVEIVNLRLKLQLTVDNPQVAPEPAGAADPSPARMGEAEVVFRDGPLASPQYQRERLRSGNRVQGPALVVQMDSTSVVPPCWGGSADPYGNLVLEPV